MRSFRSLTKLELFAALLLAGYFLYFSLGSLRTEFTPDDLMNCYFAWLRPISGHLTDMLLFFRLSPTFRPFGALIYKVSFTLFGFNLFPLRLLLLLVLGANVFLAYAVASRLTGSWEAGAIAALLRAYHENSAHLLYNTGTLYDIFCFFFYFSALLYYLGAREEGRPLRPSQVLLFSLLYILTLDSKEMAVSLPVMACAYELLFHSHQWLRPAFLRRLWRDGAAVWVSGCITAAFIAGRVSGSGSISELGGYELVISLASYLNVAGRLLDELFYAPGWFNNGRTVVFLLALLAVAWLLRSKLLLWSWLLFTVGILPIAFIPPRDLSAALIPATGLMIYGAVVLIQVRDWLLRPRLSAATPLKPVTLIVLVLFLLRVHPESRYIYRAFIPEYARIRNFREQLRDLHPQIPPRSRIIMLSDPFPEDSWDPIYIVRLLYRDASIILDRLKQMNPKPDARAIAGYDYVLRYKDNKLIELRVTMEP